MEDHPVMLENADGQSDVILVAEHAGRQLPPFVGSLGLDDEAMVSHIAWDIGVAELSRMLSRMLDAPLIMQRYSRLVYDCNRAFEAPDAIVTESDNIAVPGNAGLTAEHRKKRYEEIYMPFEAAIEALLQERKAVGIHSVLVTIHSFTPVYKGRQRHLDLGILHDADTRLADALMQQSRLENAFSTARNEPYAPADGVTHTLVRHGVNNGLLNVMFEVRNDLLGIGQSRMLWAQRLFSLLNHSLDAIAGR
jgi:predicted N-formylglutamate amidohydrolase